MQTTMQSLQMQALDDVALLDEVDEIIRGKLNAAQQSGAGAGDLRTLAKKYSRMYDLIDARLAYQPIIAASEAFKDETYDFIVEGFVDRISNVYDLDQSRDRGPSQPDANHLIYSTRYKLRRLQKALFSA